MNQIKNTSLSSGIVISHSWAGSDKTYSPKEKAREKEYNHEYYMKNKEKWGVKQEIYSDKDPDFDESYLDEKNRIGDSDFFAFKNKDGRWVIVEEDMKWVLPEGQEPDAEMRKQLSEFRGFQSPDIKTRDDWDNAVASIINKGKKVSDGESEFDIDAAALDVIRGKYKNGEERKKALGEDYDLVQKRVNEMLKGQSSAKKNQEPKNLRDKGYPSSMKQCDESEYIMHHGILGQKWGVRRYQNADGSLTSAGRRRYNTAQDRADRAKEKANSARKIANKYTDAMDKKAAKRQAQADKYAGVKKETASDRAKKMSDEELRAAINRLQMEQQYTKLSEGGKQANDGQAKKKAILATLGTVALTTAVTTLGKSYGGKIGSSIGSAAANKTIDYVGEKVAKEAVLRKLGAK